MLTQWVLFFIGVLVATTPFMGLPPSFDSAIFFVAGLSVSFVAGKAIREWSRTAHRTPTLSGSETVKEKEL